MKKWFVYGNSNTITIAFTWHRVTQVARRNGRKTEEEKGVGLSLDQGAHAHGDKLDVLSVAIANISIVNVTKIVQNYIVSSNAKQSHQIDTVVSQNER